MSIAFRQLWICAFLGFTVLGSQSAVEAGVAGQSFFTDFDSTGSPYTAVLTFDSGNSMSYDGLGGFFTGSYIELDLVVISVFTFNLDSVDRYRGIGLSLFSRRIQGIVLQDDFNQIDFSGTVVTQGTKVSPSTGDSGPNAPAP